MEEVEDLAQDPTWERNEGGFSVSPVALCDKTFLGSDGRRSAGECVVSA